MPASRQPLSVAIITLNAATQLEACLRSARFADEIVVVDSGSTDGTRELAERHGARVIDQDWLGFGPQKQFAVDAAAHDWVLCLDADERVTTELQAAIENALAAPSNNAYRFARCNRFSDATCATAKAIRTGACACSTAARRAGRTMPCNEKIITNACVGTLTGDLLHDSAETLAAYLAKQNRYTTLAAEMALAAGKRTGFARIALSPLVRFIKFYFIRQGFRDGLPGLIHIAIGCFNSFMKYSKMLERRNDSAALR